MARVNKAILLLIVWMLVMLNESSAFAASQVMKVSDAKSQSMTVSDAKKLCAPFEYDFSENVGTTKGQQSYYNSAKEAFWKVCAKKIAVATSYLANFHTLDANQYVEVSYPYPVSDKIKEFKTALSERSPKTDFVISSWEITDINNSSNPQTKQCLEVEVPGYRSAKIYCTFATSKTITPVATKNRCAATNVEGSKVSYNITSKVIECIKETMDRLFVDYSQDTSEDGIFKDLSIYSFHKFQQSFRQVVRVSLILYVIFFGIKIVTSDNMPEKSNIFSFLLKFVLVLYFAVGVTPDKVTNGRVERQDGVTQLLKPIFFNMSDFLSNIVLKSTEGNDNDTLSSDNKRPGVCNLSNNYDSEFQYLAIWDKIDCRLINYLGIVKGFFSKFLALFISMEYINFIIFCLIFLFIVSIIFFFVHIYAFSLIALTVLTFISPIFVTCILFERTKGFFDNWLKLCISFVLQPLIIMIFITFTFYTLDMLVYKGCNIKTNKNGYIEISAESNSVIDSDIPTALNVDCERSIGYLLYNTEKFVELKSMLFVEVAIVKAEARTSLMTRLSELFEFIIFLTMFSLFAESVGSFAADLTDGIAVSQMTTGAKALFNFVKEQAVSKLKGKLGGD